MFYSIKYLSSLTPLAVISLVDNTASPVLKGAQLLLLPLIVFLTWPRHVETKVCVDACQAPIKTASQIERDDMATNTEVGTSNVSYKFSFNQALLFHENMNICLFYCWAQVTVKWNMDWIRRIIPCIQSGARRASTRRRRRLQSAKNSQPH